MPSSRATRSISDVFVRPSPPATVAGASQTSADVADVLSERPQAPADDIESWAVVVDAGDEMGDRVAESILTVADGLIGTRGSLEEDGPHADAVTYVSGLYEPSEETGQALVALPSWATLDMGISPGPGRRLLDLRTGVLWRTVARGERGRFRSARWSCLDRPGTAVLVATGGRQLLEPMCRSTAAQRAERHPGVAMSVVGLADTVVDRAELGPGAARSSAATGGEISLCRIASFAVGDGGSPDLEPLDRAQRTARRRGPKELFREQCDAWARRWAVADVEVVGDPELTLAARFALFHLAGVAGPQSEAAVGARGLTGPAYAGHVLWDADVFALPVLAAAHPPAARAMLEYRVRRLPAARRKALELGYLGARFPWESAVDGTDVTPRRGVDPTGNFVPILTGDREEHITADVAWAAWHYASVTGDWSFLEGPGRELVVDTARYWASRIRMDGAGHGHIDGVIGPDEYHEDVDDNAFTNILAAWNLRAAAELARRSPPPRLAEAPMALEERQEEAQRWTALADGLVTGYDAATGRHRQFAGYDELELPLVAGLGVVPVPADIVLGRSRVAGSQIIKQADVVMAHHMVPTAMPEGSLRRDVDFYLPRTAHGSSLSPAVHAAVLARAGRLDDAVELLEIARRIDVEDMTGTTSGGLHTAALAGLWHAVVFGFAGVSVGRPDDAALVVDPRLPDHWSELRLRTQWHGRAVQLRLRSDAVSVRCAQSVTVAIGDGTAVTVTPSERWVTAER